MIGRTVTAVCALLTRCRECHRRGCPGLSFHAACETGWWK